MGHGNKGFLPRALEQTKRFAENTKEGLAAIATLALGSVVPPEAAGKTAEQHPGSIFPTLLLFWILYYYFFRKKKNSSDKK